jgi:hypothetical protein
LAALLLPGLPGCTEYLGDYQYMPRPLLAEVPPTPPLTAPPLAVLASVMGVHRADSKQAIPESVEVRLRLDNHGPGLVTFNPQSLELTSGALVRFPPAVTSPAPPLSVPTGQSATIIAYFPFPPGQSYHHTDLESLQLRWLVQIAGQTIAQVANFRRVYPRYYYDPYAGPYAPYPYAYPYPWYGSTVVVVRHR